jgi:hypothetical protein
MTRAQIESKYGFNMQVSAQTMAAVARIASKASVSAILIS